MQRPHQAIGKHRDPVFSSLAPLDGDLPPREVEIFDSERERLEQSQSTSIHEHRNQAARPRHSAVNCHHLARAEHDRQPDDSPGANQAVEPCRLAAQHPPVEKEQCGMGLILSGGADLTIDGKM